MNSVRKLRYKTKRIYSPWKKKLLLFLLGGFVAGATKSPFKIGKFWKSIPKELEKIDRYYLKALINEFKYDRLVDAVDVSDDETRIVLTEKGKLRALQFKIDDMIVKEPKTWNGTWHLVIFDIPEARRNARDALRRKLKELGFYEIQKSVFIYPFECENEIDFIAEIFQIRSHVRYARISTITNEPELKKHFNL